MTSDPSLSISNTFDATSFTNANVMVGNQVTGDIIQITNYASQPIAPPPPLREAPLTDTFVGRERDLAFVLEQTSRSHMVVINGVRGVGKTAFAAKLARSIQPQVPLFWHTFHHNEGIAELIQRLAAFLYHHGEPSMWNHLQATQQHPTSQQSPTVLLDYVIHGVANIHSIVCLDDLHLVEHDPLIQELTRQLRATVRNGAVTLIMTTRHPLNLGDTGPVFTMSGLDIQDTEQFLSQRNITLPEALIQDVYQRTEGNAEYLVLASAILQQSANPAPFIARLTQVESIQNFLMDEVDTHLTDDEKAIMNAVCIFGGHEVNRVAIEAVIETNVARLLPQLHRRGLLIRQDQGEQPVFRQHSLIQEFYYDLLSKRERQELHQRAATYYEEVEGEGLRAAQQYRAARNDADAARVALKAVWSAINRGQIHAVITLFEDLSVQRLERVQTLHINIALGDAFVVLGEKSRAEAAYTQALALVDANLPDDVRRPAQVAIYCGMSRVLDYDDPQTALEWIERGLAEHGSSNAADLQLLHIRKAAILLVLGEYREAVAQLTTLVAELPPAALQWRADCAVNLGIAYCCLGETTQGLAFYNQALAGYEQLHNQWTLVAVQHNIAVEYQILGEWTKAQAMYETALALSKQLGSIPHQIPILVNLGMIYGFQGDSTTAADHFHTAIQLADAHQFGEYQVAARCAYADMLLRRDEWQAAEPWVSEAATYEHARSGQDQLHEVYRLQAQITLARNQLDQAHALIEHSLTHAREFELVDEEAKSLRIQGEILWARGVRAEAIETFKTSLALATEGDVYERARTQATFGYYLLTQPAFVTAGRALLTTALNAFTRLGAQDDVQRVRKTLE